jgi:PAS domain S-box-containing protein
MAVIEDETERIAAEAALAESERRFRAIFQGSKAIMLLIEPDTGRLLDANPAALAFYGYSRKRFLSLRISQLNTLPEEEILAEMQRARSGARLHFDFRHRLADGRIRDVEIYSGPIEAGGKKLLFSVIHDVTDRHEAERALQVSQEDLRKSLERIRRSWEQTVEVLSGLVELRDPYTAGHQKGVARLARAIALRLGLEEERVRGVTLAATIHDVGKINVPAEILSKPGQLSQLEANLVRLHPQSGCEALKGIDVPWPLAEIVHQHHERMDGSGYPRGLKGGEILLEARIIAVADVVEAMCSHRPYRAAFGVPAALGEIRSGAGHLYDEPVVGACLSVFEEEGFRFEEPGKAEGRDT